MPDIPRDTVRAMLADADPSQHEAILSRLAERGYRVSDAPNPETGSPSLVQRGLQGAEAAAFGALPFTRPDLLMRAGKAFIGAEQPTATRPAEQAAEFIGREGLPIAATTIGQMGGMIAGAPMGPAGVWAGGAAGAGAGAGVGRIAQSALQAAYQRASGRTSSPLPYSQAGREAAVQAGLSAAFGAPGAVMGALATKGGARVGAQLLRAGPAIPENIGQSVLRDPSILSRALPVEQSGEQFGEVIKSAGLQNGPEALMAQTGKFILGQESKLNLVNESYGKMQAGALTAQEGIVAREQLAKLINSARMGNPELASEKRVLSQMLDQFDAYLEPGVDPLRESLGIVPEPGIPGYGAVRKAYRESKIAEAFSSWLPQNKNLSPNVLRTWGAGAAAMEGMVRGSPLGFMAFPFISPKIAGLAIRGGAAVSKVTSGMRPFVPAGTYTLRELYNGGAPSQPQ